MPRFQHPEYLYALALLPVMGGLYYYVLYWKKKTAARIGDPRLVAELIRNYSARRFAFKFALMLLAFTAGVVALANPRGRAGEEKITRNGIDVMIALDVSKSMLAQDIKPTRLDRARQLLGRLIDRLSNDRIGLVVFAGKAYLQMPLTGDHGAAKMYLSAASPDAVPTQGTVLSEALKMCYAGFNTQEKKYKSIVLISDGEDHDEGAVKLASQLADAGIVINTVGIGSPEGAVITDPATNEPKKDEQGNTVVTKLNEKELQELAAKTNGIYQLYTNTEEVSSRLEAQLDSMDQRPVTEDALVNYRYYFQWLLLLAVLALVAESLLPERKKIMNNLAAAPSLKLMLCLLAGFLLPGILQAQNDKALIKKGNKEYAKEQYDKAAQEYRKALEKNPANATARFNLGNALYRNNKTDEAVNAFDAAANAAESKKDKAKALYNKGVVLQNKNKLADCIDAYKNSLKLNPGDEDTRQNLQLALKQQRQQQQQQQQNDKKKQDPRKKNDQQKQNPKDENKPNQPKPAPSKISKQDAEQKLKALLQQEQNLQDKLRKIPAGAPVSPEKDW